MIDQKTDRLKLPLPNVDNFLEDDVTRIRDALTKLDHAATVDDNGVIVSSQLPTDLAYLDKNRKIPVENLPSIAISEPFVVVSTEEMLALDAQVGDVALFQNNNVSFMLAQMPPNLLGNWKELVSTQVRSVNGRTGNVKVAEPGKNSDITELTGLMGPLRLGGDAADPYDAVTLRQLQANSGGSGASMTGVMNNGIGAVDWFGGSRAKLWAGTIPADGQCLSRAANPDLWAAVSSGMLNAVSDAAWLSDPNVTTAPQIYYNRGKYSTGGEAGTCPDTSIKDAWFRAPDLNGVQPNSIKGIFLRGDGGSDSTFGGSSGVLRASAAPNIIGSFASAYSINLAILEGATGAFVPSGPLVTKVLNATNATLDTVTARQSSISFGADRSNATYGRDSTAEIRPNSAKGIWVIRASGAFTAANTNFNVVNGDTAKPSNGTVVYGGEVISNYQVAGADYVTVKMRARITVGASSTAEFVLVDSSGATVTNKAWQMPPFAGTLALNNDPKFYTLDGNSGGSISSAIDVYGQVCALSNPPAGVQNGTYLNSGILKARLNGRGATVDPLGGYFAMYLQEYVGSYHRGIINLNAFGKDISWVMGGDGQTLSPLGQLAVSGSDVRLKEEFTSASAGAGERIDRLAPLEFTWLGSQRRARGWVAQQAADIDPLYVFLGGEGTDVNGEKFEILNVDQNAIIADLIAVAQELRAEVKDLRAEVAALKGASISAS